MATIKILRLLLFFCNIVIIVTSTNWYYKAKGDKKFVEHIEFTSYVMQSTVQCAAKCNDWEPCREFGVSPLIENTTDTDYNCMLSSGNAGCRGNESNWQSFRKYFTGVEKSIVEDTCKFILKEQVAKNAASKGKYAIFCDGYNKVPKTKTFFFEIRFLNSASRKVDAYNFVTVGNHKIYNISASRDNFNFEKSDGTSKLVCPEQAAVVEIVVNAKSEFTSMACRYVLKKYILGKEVEIEIVQDTDTEEWIAKCPIFRNGIHVLIGFQFRNSASRNIEAYNFVNIGSKKILDLNAPRDDFAFPKSGGTSKLVCPKQAVIVEIVVNAKSEFATMSCRYVLEKYKLGKKVEVEIVQDEVTEEWIAKCPTFQNGIHVLVGFQFDGHMISRIICSVLKHK
ncbi:uncharacterized protein LOC111619187 [Centruroides sculpturatus]|uniref:uncharacterized protein LOC111619187 n=1 Tax=Centruroides sculpturatus TaxID=218467 RepID=UPI000C6E893B|nr:uncharacterized protein LOC111619187 [Centruroides sculpturatus]